ncbi:hypothetical protein J8F10_18235 [Gemmata sp. G18]|uniref:Uncharacterized protein n=1 Tax=Gemmata palustris TaxID=2822762 RepID=A0ABS5BU00_9BACT|nr:hypothetical protein [Gemmata palustris]MBP3957204.1 hypothetical protein [Gemmata palustris]
MFNGTVWELGLGTEVISTIRETSYESPWTYGELNNPAKFDRFRVYFGSDEDWPESAEFEALLNEIRSKGGFWLRDTASNEQLNNVYPINHDGASGVWFRTHR